MVALHTHPVGIHDELQDVAGISGQGSHSCAWDQLTVVLEKQHKKDGLLMTGEHSWINSFPCTCKLPRVL